MIGSRRIFSVVRRLLPVALPLALTLSVGCLGEPEIDERWTLVQFLEADPQPGQTAAPAQPLDVSVEGRITYRSILTGFLVAEVRYSDTVTPASVDLDPSRHTEEIAKEIDLILANSVTAGRATRAVTGWDHLMQDFTLSFTAQVPDSAGNGGLFLLLYMGDGDEIRLQDGRDSLVVTPFVSGEREVLHTGFALNTSGGGS
ncbi:MAG: hypothetical protein PVF33_13475 [Candidatus Latescibacterota bacterium]|jgi:hypothetical protein